jgi:hypothetical protein
MKNTIKVLVFSLISQVIFAQNAPNFSLKWLHLINQQLVKEPVTLFEKGTTEGYVFTTGNGKQTSKAEVLKAYTDLYTPVGFETSNETVQQIGGTAIVRGSIVQKTALKQNPSIVDIYKGSFTYVFIYDNTAWKLASSHHSDTYEDKLSAETAIKAVIEGETQAYIDGDGKKLLSYWADKKTNESASQYLVPILGQPFAKGASMEKLQNVVVPNLKKQDFSVERSDFEIRINKNMAWATYTQKAMANGTVTQTIRETRILELINGDWKIVYVGEQAMK